MSSLLDSSCSLDFGMSLTDMIDSDMRASLEMFDEEVNLDSNKRLTPAPAPTPTVVVDSSPCLVSPPAPIGDGQQMLAPLNLDDLNHTAFTSELDLDPIPLAVVSGRDDTMTNANVGLNCDAEPLVSGRRQSVSSPDTGIASVDDDPGRLADIGDFVSSIDSLLGDFCQDAISDFVIKKEEPLDDECYDLMPGLGQVQQNPLAAVVGANDVILNDVSSAFALPHTSLSSVLSQPCSPMLRGDITQPVSLDGPSFSPLFIQNRYQAVPQQPTSTMSTRSLAETAIPVSTYLASLSSATTAMPPSSVVPAECQLVSPEQIINIASQPAVAGGGRLVRHAVGMNGDANCLHAASAGGNVPLRPLSSNIINLQPDLLNVHPQAYGTCLVPQTTPQLAVKYVIKGEKKQRLPVKNSGGNKKNGKGAAKRQLQQQYALSQQSGTLLPAGQVAKMARLESPVVSVSGVGGMVCNKNSVVTSPTALAKNNIIISNAGRSSRQKMATIMASTPGLGVIDHMSSTSVVVPTSSAPTSDRSIIRGYCKISPAVDLPTTGMPGIISGGSASNTKASTNDLAKRLHLNSGSDHHHHQPHQHSRTHDHHRANAAAAASLSSKFSAELNCLPKPAYSYSCMISLALKNSLNGSMSVSEIYKFMCEHFPYFRTAPSGWKNSVRHNLSLNKCFEKIERSSEDAKENQRKGCLWALNPEKVTKMEDELHKWSAKDPLAIKKGMAIPDNLEALERGELVKDYAIVSDEEDAILSATRQEAAAAHSANQKVMVHSVTTSSGGQSVVRVVPPAMSVHQTIYQTASPLASATNTSSPGLNQPPNSLQPATHVVQVVNSANGIRTTKIVPVVSSQQIAHSAPIMASVAATSVQQMPVSSTTTRVIQLNSPFSGLSSSASSSSSAGAPGNSSGRPVFTTAPLSGDPMNVGSRVVHIVSNQDVAAAKKPRMIMVMNNA